MCERVLRSARQRLDADLAKPVVYVAPTREFRTIKTFDDCDLAAPRSRVQPFGGFPHIRRFLKVFLSQRLAAMATAWVESH
jgi:hypothetical protein